ncbi:NAD-dependent dehydratase [Mitsuaria sp. WAJ17]|uniref:NAD-dependent dehydratase n=1 Tax=Mitsuaria sp. WAJ17 TaxID=2761452 RepID=UPI00160103B8|nr:NAD-dependent dehydratase [Mitsuaria sp. WAJ17]MBB2487786.1 NAD-dependent dehydratase [Mitsuaria sp. WAJ17]
MSTLLLLGCTGLVGQQLLALALADPAVSQVVAPTRRPLPTQPRLLTPPIDYEQLPANAPWWRADAVLCALGTTLRQAGSPEAFRRVDHDYVLAACRLARHAGTPRCGFVSSLGADAHSRGLYLRVKGETELALQALGFESLACVRPSLLDGGPRPDPRPGETLALALSRGLGPLLPRGWRPVRTERVARALYDAVREGRPGLQIIPSEALQA